jgi:dTDP-4-amino-4,6-dideoxygalactose transaminase
VSEAKANTVVSLPMHPYLEPKVQDEIIAKIRAFNG